MFEFIVIGGHFYRKEIWRFQKYNDKTLTRTIDKGQHKHVDSILIKNKCDFSQLFLVSF